MVGLVRHVRGNTRKRWIATTFVMSHRRHRSKQSQMRLRGGVGEGLEKIGPRLRRRKSFLLSTTRCGHFDTLGKSKALPVQLTTITNRLKATHCRRGYFR